MLQSILGSGRNGRNLGPSGSSVFPNINVNGIATQLRVDQRGAQRGVKNQPSSQDTSFDKVEHEIVNQVKSIRDQGLKNCDDHARVYDKRITDGVGMEIQIRKVCDTTLTDFQAVVAKHQDDLDKAHEAERQADVALQQFRDYNRINDPPYDENGFPKWFAISLVIIAAESVLNGVFFAKAHEMGLAGGIGNALAISVVNVGLASLAGLVTRNFNHVEPWRKVIGTLSFLGAAGLALLFNFVVAHFRDAMTAAAWDQAAGRAVERAIAVHFPESIDAWLLALLGLLAAALAGWKTYGADHPYPGYGRISRKRKEAYETYYDKRETAITIVTEKRDEFNNKLSAANATINSAARARSEYKLLHKERSSFLQQCDQAVNGLLTRYRSANQSQRSQRPPEHFKEEYYFPKIPPLDDLSSAMHLPGTGLEAVVGDSLQKIHSACEDAINAFQKVDKRDNPMP